MKLEVRFWLKVYPRGDCWEWRAGRVAGGYGNVKVGGGTVMAHRLAFEFAKGTIPPTLTTDHLCNHPWCVRPSHMVLATRRENILRGNALGAVNARKTHCKNGHRLDEATIRRAYGTRRCLICYRAYDSGRRRALRAGRIFEWP